ncbi:MAG: starch-binding protein [Ruminococcus sp.]|nr:starch-binding protein [Ruminococcus sp.]
MNKKVTSLVLAVCMLLSCLAVGSFTANASTTDAAVSAQADDDVAASYGLASKVEDGNILHCFNWTLAQIKQELPNIAKAGFTSVQTSPLQAHNASGTWYWLYQPNGFSIGNELGSYSDLQSLCSEADKYGIKVVVDVVANHLAGWNDGRWADSIESNMKKSEYFHNMGACSNWDNRYDVTHKNIGMPDLNSEHGDVQNIVAAMINKMKSAGVDGIRWDAAKHIGLPSEGCGFWSKMASLGVYNYGEILDNPAGNSGDSYNSSLMAEYGKYIGVTDATYSGTITGAIRDGSTAQSNGNWVNRGVPANRVVYWAESHDTYCNNGWTNGLSENTMDRAYAVLGAKANSQALYLSRPFEKNHESIMYGKKGSTHFTSTEVAAVNHFHNAMVGTKEYYTTGNNCFVVCREGGAVIVAARGSNFDVTVPNGGGIVKQGSYKDEVSGGTWNVSGSNISGHIGSSGIAVIYSAKPAGPSASVEPGSTSYTTDTLSLKLSYENATSGQYSVDGGSFQSFSNGQTITIGSGKPYGTQTTVVVKASGNGTTSDPETYTYTKADPNAVQTVNFDNSAYNWSNVYAYIYNDGATSGNPTWPGTAMNKGANNIYSLNVPKGFENGLVIFTESETATDHRYPADMEPGLPLSGASKILKANHSWEDYSGGGTTPTQPVTQKPTDPPVGNVLIGDTSGDNRITISDATYVQLHISGQSTLSGDRLTAADVDKSGRVDINDATLIQLYLVYVRTSGNYCGTYTGGGSYEDPTQYVEPTTAYVPDGDYVYYQDTNSWGNVNAYMWSDSGEAQAWPGQSMENIGNGVFRIKIPSGVDKIIFSNNGNNQTGNLDLPGAGQIYNNGSWSSYSGGGGTIVNPPVSGNYVYYQDTNNWGNVNAYMWSGSGEAQAWPGRSMENIGNGVFRIEIPSGMNKIIFSNNGNNKTGDLDLPGAGQIYNNGNWSSYSG